MVIMTSRLSICLSGWLIGLLWLVPTVQAHLTTYTGAERSSTVAEVWIDTDRITLRMEIGDQDREAFAALLGERDAAEQGDPGLVLTGAHGKPLVGEIAVVASRPREDRSATPQPVAGQTRASPMVTYAEIVYPLKTHPATLTLAPPRPAERREAAVEIGFIVYHDAIPVIDFQYLRQPETLRLDWRDPWYTAFENPALRRHHRAPLMTFLYIEPYEVRFEILIRLKALAAWMSLDVQRTTQIDADERTRLREQIGSFVLQQSRVQINGTPSRPLLDRVEFVKATPQGIQPLEATERLTFHTALVGVILAYLTPGLPQEVKVDWPFFNDQITSIPSSVIDPVGQLSYDITPAQPTLRWTNILEKYNYQAATIDAIAAPDVAQIDVPLLSLGLCLVAVLLLGVGRYLRPKRVYGMTAAVLMLVIAVLVWPFGRLAVQHPFAAPDALPEVEALLILQDLLQNTYRAFDFRNENDVYDKLAVSISGDLITDVYLQNRQRLEMADQGGARARVQDVQLLDATPSGPPGRQQRLTFQCVWRITGTVNHWGHSHQRRNQYEAMMTIQPIEQTWKIVALDLLDEKRLP